MVAEAQSSYRRAWDHCLVKYSSQKTTVIEASHGNAGVWKAWKGKKPAFPPSNTHWKSLRGFPHYHGYGDDYHVSEDRQSPPKTRNQSHSRRKGLVNHVPGLKRKGCPGTLRLRVCNSHRNPEAQAAWWCFDDPTTSVEIC